MPRWLEMNKDVGIVSSFEREGTSYVHDVNVYDGSDV
jgi:hypothetical protein